ncbi:MAG: VOC family protein [Acidobacteriota bacterium]
MKTDLHLHFDGNCTEAFAFYEKTFNSEIAMCMKYSDAPAGNPVPPDMADKVMHASLPIGTILLMGCDVPKDRCGLPLGGFQISVSDADEAEVKRLYAALSDGGSVQMPLMPTFWSPLFGMCTDKFGVAWMVGVPGPQM